MTTPGLDLDRLGAWLATNLPEAGPDLSARLIVGGRSNLTYELSDGTRSWIVRRPPLGQVLATAHDMTREFRVMSALEGTDVPVPRTYASCEDASVLGAHFYVMERVAGTPYKFVADIAPIGPERTRAVAEAMVDTLAALHAVDPERVGLADFGRPSGYLARQVSRWKKQLDASSSRPLRAADELHVRLAATVPAESATGIVHGDFRLDNLLVDDEDRVAAVLDWEMATLGDPLADLALMVVYGRLGTGAVGNGVGDVTAAPGFLSEEETVARYAAASPRDLGRFGFHLGLASFKLAAILEGIHYRFVHGQTVGEGFSMIGDVVPIVLDAGLEALKEH